MRFAIEGLIGAGKTETLEYLKNIYGQRIALEPTHAWTLLPCFYNDLKTYAYPFQMQVMASYAHTDYHKASIMERSPDSAAGVFAEQLYVDAIMSRPDYGRVMDAFATMPVARADEFIYIDLPIDVCLERIKKRARPSEDVTAEYLRSLKDAYVRFFNICGRHVHYIKLDGTESVEAVAQQIYVILKRYL